MWKAKWLNLWRRHSVPRYLGINSADSGKTVFLSSNLDAKYTTTEAKCDVLKKKTRQIAVKAYKQNVLENMTLNKTAYGVTLYRILVF